MGRRKLGYYEKLTLDGIDTTSRRKKRIRQLKALASRISGSKKIRIEQKIAHLESIT